MAHRNNGNKLDTVMEMLIENGFESFADVLRILLNQAMKIERDHALGTALYERTDKRRTRVARLFANEASLLRLVSAIEMEISEDYIAGKRYLDMNVEMENEGESANSKQKRIYRKNVA